MAAGGERSEAARTRSGLLVEVDAECNGDAEEGVLEKPQEEEFRISIARTRRETRPPTASAALSQQAAATDILKRRFGHLVCLLIPQAPATAAGRERTAAAQQQGLSRHSNGREEERISSAALAH